jgi:hypothetical protein
MKKAAIITGDIVHSRNIDKTYREELIRVLKDAYPEVDRKLCGNRQGEALEFFRGDSFQARVSCPEYALRMSFIIRAKIRSMTVMKGHTARLSSIWDARIAVGYDDVSFISRNISESDGAAFVLSGNALDGMKNKDERIRAETFDKRFNEEFRIQLLLADTIVKRWTVAQSAAAFHYLSEYEKTQTELSGMMGITQSSFSRRMQSGNIECIHLLCQRFETLIPQLS